MRRYHSALVFAVLLVLFSCQGAAPRIDGTEWELMRIRSPRDGLIRERLSLFIRADDEDGADDLEDLYLLHQQSRLFWHFTAGQWERRSRDGDDWLGSSAISGPDGIPRGEYRLVLIDRGGEQAEDRLYIDLPEAPAADNPADPAEKFPVLQRRGEFFILSGGESSGAYYLVGEDEEHSVAVSFQVTETRVFIQDHVSPEQAESLDWYVFVLNRGRGWYVGSGPYRF